MQNVQSSLLARSDTLFGVCQALGTDFGISPNWIRIAFAAVVIVNLEAALIAYAVAGAIVAISRFAVPSPRLAPEPGDADATPVIVAPVAAHSERVLEAA